jgi:hypothetical protein
MSASSPCIASWPPTAGKPGLTRQSATNRDCTRSGVINDADHQPNTGESGRLPSTDPADQRLRNRATPRLPVHRCACESPPDGPAAHCHVSGPWPPRLVRGDADGKSVVGVVASTTHREHRRYLAPHLDNARAGSLRTHTLETRAGYVAPRAAVGVGIKSAASRGRNSLLRRHHPAHSISEGLARRRRTGPIEPTSNERWPWQTLGRHPLLRLTFEGGRRQ